MPEEGIILRDRAEFMTQEELLAIAKSFVNLGVTKIRLTGGEPLIKKNFAEIITALSALKIELTITTNGILLDKYFDVLKQSGVKSLNISLDSLIEERNFQISRRDYFKRINDNIHEAVRLGFEVKLNCVLMRNFNDDEIIDFINLTLNKPLNIRFIEFMPFDGNKWDKSKTISEQEILEKVKTHFGDSNLIKTIDPQNSTSRNYQIKNAKGNFGIIATITNPFCDSCNRLRLTADGKIKNCLFSNEETNLLEAFRKGEPIEALIKSSVLKKKKSLGGIVNFEKDATNHENRSMIRIGG